MHKNPLPTRLNGGMMFTKIELEVIREAMDDYSPSCNDQISEDEWNANQEKNNVADCLVIRFTALCEDYK